MPEKSNYEERSWAPKKAIIHNIPPEPELITFWVNEHGSLGQEEISGYQFYFRPLLRKEHKKILLQSQDNSVIYEDLLCQEATLWPENFDFSGENLPAGVNSSLAQEILTLSGFTQEASEELFKYWRAQIHDVQERHCLIILMSFPHLTLDMLDSMSNETFYRYLAYAEFIQNINFSIKGVDSRPVVKLLLADNDEYVIEAKRLDEQAKAQQAPQLSQQQIQKAQMRQRMGR
jgi:hypothetical protein